MSLGFQSRYVAIALCLGVALNVFGENRLLLSKLPVSVVRPGDSLSLSFTLAGNPYSSNAITVDFFLVAFGSSEKSLLSSQRVQGPGIYNADLKLVPICGSSVTNWRIEASERSQPSSESAYSEPFAFSNEPAKLYFVPVNGTNQVALTWKTNGAPYTTRFAMSDSIIARLQLTNHGCATAQNCQLRAELDGTIIPIGNPLPDLAVGDVLPQMFRLPMERIRVGEHTLRFSVLGGNDSEHGQVLAHFSMLNAQRPSAPQSIRIGVQR